MLREQEGCSIRASRCLCRRGMTKDQTLDYLNAKSDALKAMDPEGGRQKATKQFLDEKSYKPGLGDFAR